MSRWTGKRREFRQAGREHTLVWSIQVDGATDTVVYGVFNGKLQEVSNTYEAVNKGKSNELSPRENALKRAERKILMKTREGFMEYENGKALTSRVSIVDPNSALPENLAFYKPSNTLSLGLQKKAREGEVLFTRKRDGVMFVVRTTNDDVELYSRRMLQGHHLEDEAYVERFPHLYEEVLILLQRGKIPPNSLILGELIADKKGQDDLSHVQSVIKSLTPESVARQKMGGKLSYYVWDIAVWNGAEVLSVMTTQERQELLTKVFDGCQWFLPVDVWDFENIWQEGVEAVLARNPGWVFSKQQSDMPHVAVFVEGESTREFYLDELANQIAIHLKWEGWVVVDPTIPLGPTSMNFRGKADRPSKSSGKLKPLHEDDFIVEWDPDKGVGSYGTGKNQGKVGALGLYQLNADLDMVYISDVTGGIKDRHSKDYPEGLLRDDLSKIDAYPLVAQVAFTDRSYIKSGDKTNALMFARILRFRDDKDPEECINPKL